MRNESVAGCFALEGWPPNYTSTKGHCEGVLPHRLVNESLQMLARYPELNTKILPLMEDYLVALRYKKEHIM